MRYAKNMSNQIISQEGYKKLKQELEQLHAKRVKISQRIAIAKELGDLSENAEYHEAKDAQGFNEGRIAEINSLLKNVTIIKKTRSKEEVGIGSIIIVEVNQKKKQYTIVSFNESDPLEGKISNESPLGAAFLHKRKNDQVVVHTPKGEMEYRIISIN
ncbi:MAG: transcription elongation factor GreA [Patescibacteria group bacterium]|nr:transcription elongation factor GreA [Patescibacteria group bacterium]MBU1684333.1 transcription elongation factor GreA [Patescibacteria group bacterium]MBU1778110.1 transcription elongation factor GreA [Patescibacteria group bacterium]MBU2456767.1 transcription elongation factor GreA [Patescibacteria group bacterium]